MRTPPREADLSEIDSEAALAVMRAAGRALLTEPEGKAVLAAYGIPTVPTRVAASPQEVEEVAAALLSEAPALAIKILSDDISHKSDVGGVRLAIKTAQEAADAARTMLAKVHATQPSALIRGFTVQPMIVRPHAHELIIGVSEDPTVGPLMMFGAGGTAVEVIADTAHALPPLDLKLAGQLIDETRISRLLAGYRDRPRADTAAIAQALVRVSYLVTDHPAIRELDINPLLADEHGCIALDARVRVEPRDLSLPGPNPRLAIRPYPNQWEASAETAEGMRLLIRPIRPTDEALLAAFQTKLSPEDIRLRFLAPRKEFSHKTNARFTQIDYARAMAFVALSQDQQELLGVARLAADPDYTSAEYAIIVRSDLKRRGHRLGIDATSHPLCRKRGAS